LIFEWALQQCSATALPVIELRVWLYTAGEVWCLWYIALLCLS